MSMPAPSLRRSVLAVALATSLLAACAPKDQEEAAEPAAPQAERVENAELGIAVAALPAFFKVSKNEGATIELVPADPQVAGVLVIGESEERKGGINLVAAVERHKADLEGRTDGVFKGQRELGTQLGTAFYSRGQFTAEDGTASEETAIFVIHPKGDRELSMVYTYPAGGDSQTRLTDQLFSVLGELEAVEAEPSDAPADAEG